MKVIFLMTRSMLLATACGFMIAYSPANAGTVNILNYGGKGDGTTDNLTAIKKAVIAAGASGDVYFPAGNYLYSASFSAHSLSGDGPTSVLVASNNQSSTIKVSGAGLSVSKLAIKTLHVPDIYAIFNAGDTANGANADGLLVKSASRNFSINNLSVSNVCNNAIELDQSNTGNINNCVINSPGSGGIVLQDDYLVSIVNNTVNGAGASLTASHSGANTLLHNLTIKNNTFVGPSASAPSAILGDGTVSLVGLSTSLVTGNSFSNMRGTALSISATQRLLSASHAVIPAALSVNLTVSNNTINNCGSVAGYQWAVIIGASGAEPDPVTKVVPAYLGPAMTNFTFTGNTIANCPATISPGGGTGGLMVGSGADATKGNYMKNCLVSKNTIDHTAIVGVFLNGAEVTLDSNVIQNTGETGIYDAGPSGPNTISNNKLTNCGLNPRPVAGSDQMSQFWAQWDSDWNGAHNAVIDTSAGGNAVLPGARMQKFLNNNYAGAVDTLAYYIYCSYVPAQVKASGNTESVQLPSYFAP